MSWIGEELGVGVKCLDITIDISSESSLKAGAASVLKQIRPSWDSTEWKVFTDGITNKLIGGWNKDKQDTVLVRVYGIGTEAIIDRRCELENMRRLDGIGAGSRLYAVFNNGIAYQFIHGDIITQQTVKDRSVFPLIASMMAKVHSIDIGEKPSGLWGRMEKFIELAPSSSQLPKHKTQIDNELMTRDQFTAEYHMLKDLLDNCSSPIVFCHNDALLANIVLQKDRVVFIDMEYGGPAPAAFDVANHFAEFVGCDGELDYLTLFPSREFQLDWIRIYLTEYNRLAGETAPTDGQVEEMYDLVQKFVLCTHLLWINWCLIQCLNSNIEFDFIGYAAQRLREYRRIKALLNL